MQPRGHGASDGRRDGDVAAGCEAVPGHRTDASADAVDVEVAIEDEGSQADDEDRTEEGGGAEVVVFEGSEGAVGGAFGEDPSDRFLEALVDPGGDVGELAGAA